MTGSKQKNGKLDLNWGLRDIGIVVEDVVVIDLVDDAVKGVGVNAYFFPILIKVAIAPVFEKVELQQLLDRRVIAKNP